MGCIESSQSHRKHVMPPFRPTGAEVRHGSLLMSNNGGKLKKMFVRMFADSSVAWFKSPKNKQPLGFVQLKTVCSMLLVGPVCKRIPSCPKKIPKKTTFSYMIAFPMWCTGHAPVIFLLCPNEIAMGGWMTSIADVLPPPQMGPQNMMPSAPPAGGYPPPYPPPGQIQGQGQPLPVYTQSGGGSNHHSTGSSNDFCKGLMVGGLLGYGFGRPWGWGWGWGWGYHPGYGWGYADFDVHIDHDHDCHMDNMDDAGSVGSFGGSDFNDFDHGVADGGEFDYNNVDPATDPGYGAEDGFYGGDAGGGGGGGDWGGPGDYGGGGFDSGGGGGGGFDSGGGGGGGFDSGGGGAACGGGGGGGGGGDGGGGGGGGCGGGGGGGCGG